MEFLKPLISAPQTTRARVNAALEAMVAAAAERGVGDAGKRAAIGYCFGGSNVLDLARSGADVAAVVSLHGNLGTSLPGKAGEVKARVLVVHGADDPVAPKSDGLRSFMRTRLYRDRDGTLAPRDDPTRSVVNGAIVRDRPAPCKSAPRPSPAGHKTGPTG